MNKEIIMARITIAIVFIAMIFATTSVYNKCEQVKEQKAEILKYKAEINNYINYYNAAEDLLESIDADINISDTYMCGDIGANYIFAVSKINDSIRVKPSNYKPINKHYYGE